MPRKKKSMVEIMPPEAALVPKATANLQSMIEAAVRNRMDEMIQATRGTDQLDEYQPRVRRHHPGFERVKGALYFEKWGCKMCGRKRQVNHASKGRCSTCVQLEYEREKALEREWLLNHPESLIDENIDRLTRRLRSAQELLGTQDDTADR